MSVFGPENLTLGNPVTKRFKPDKEIEFGALATHHIHLHELEGCPSHKEFILPNDSKYLIGYNVDYDWEAALNSGKQPLLKRIDLLPLSRYLYPELDSYKQIAVFYSIKGPSGKEMAKKAHSAEDDVMICECILEHILNILKPETWEELWQFSEEAKVPLYMPVGKYKGLHMSEIPEDYKKWFLSQPDVNPYLLKALLKKDW